MQRVLGYEEDRQTAKGEANAAHLERVRDNLAAYVCAFLQQVMNRPGAKVFTKAQLEQWVSKRRQCAPGSASRIMRDARTRGHCCVKEYDRAKSQYRVEWVRPFEEWVPRKTNQRESLRGRIAYHEETAQRLRKKLEGLG